jgi:DNA-binding FadR family transcriptional regulator
VLREAVRVLEHHQVARMRRGPGGGLFVAEPGIEAVTDAVALQVARQGIEPAQLFEVRSAVEMAVLDRVMATLSADGADRLRTALDAERAASLDHDEFAVVGHDLHNVLAEVAGNPVSELLTMVLVLLTRLRVAPPAGATDPFPTQDAIDVHRRIVDAILAGDHDLARHRMRRHLDALVAWVR